MLGFERRHPEISRKRTEILTKARAKGLSQDVVDTFFKMYSEILKESDIKDANRIFNLDETGMNTDARNQKMFFQKGKKKHISKDANLWKNHFHCFILLFGKWLFSSTICGLQRKILVRQMDGTGTFRC